MVFLNYNFRKGLIFYLVIRNYKYDSKESYVKFKLLFCVINDYLIV